MEIQESVMLVIVLACLADGAAFSGEDPAYRGKDSGAVNGNSCLEVSGRGSVGVQVLGQYSDDLETVIKARMFWQWKCTYMFLVVVVVAVWW